VRILSFEHKGTEAFPQPVSINFEQLPDIVVACGPIGAGKTTGLDLIAASMYLTMPYRAGALYSSFVAPGYVRVRSTHRGHEYYAVLTIDPKVRKTEAMLYEDGQPIAGPNQAEFKAKTEVIFGSLDLFLVTSYAAQYSQTSTARPVTFMGVQRTERRAIMASLLGLARYDASKITADLQVAATEKLMEAARARRKMIDAQAATVPGLTTEAAAAAEQVEATQSAVEWAEASLDNIQQSVVSQAAVIASLSGLDAQLPTARRRRDDLGIRLSTLRQPIAYTPISPADIADVEEAIRTCEDEIAKIDVQLDSARRASQQVTEAEHGIKERQTLLNELPILTRVPCGGQGEFAACPFIVRAVEIRGREQALSDELVSLTALAQGMRVESQRHNDLQRAKEKARIAGSRYQSDLAKKRTAFTEMERAAQREQSRVEQLAQVEREHEEAEQALAAVAAARAAIVAKLTPGLQDEAEAAGKALREAHVAHEGAVKRAGVVAQRLADAQGAAERMAQIDRELVELQDAWEQWGIIARGVGPTGIPALRVDLALPSISDLATELLRECFGEGRWTVAVVSQKASARHALMETLEVQVQRNGKTIDADRLSGGEGVIVNEAVSLALAMYRGTRESSLWEAGLILRDETTSALGDLAPAYIEMFRNVIMRGGATQVLIVSHQLNVIDRADARLRFGGGNIVVA
jgi:DNA repair exonuclease SbcCD ATPase subunit